MRRLLALCLTLFLLAGSTASAQVVPAHETWRDQSIYFIMIDRFHDGDESNNTGVNRANIRGWHGGDLVGIIQKLDYIQSLGFTAIWITPHVKNWGIDYHGYGAVDFYEVDPHFGTMDELKRLVTEAHKRNMRVIFDIVVNHTGPNHPLVAEKPEWFHPRRPITDWNDKQQVQEGWIFDLPDFNQSIPEVREYILDYSRFWIEQTGVDGFRIDTVKHVPEEFFTWYAAELEKIKPGFWLIGEHWTNSPTQIAQYQQAGIPALLDFPASELARRTFARDNAMTSLAAMTYRMGTTMPNPGQTGAFLDNHDMTRFATEAINDPVGRLKLGLTWLFTQRAIPIVYYGTEIAMPGGNDPYNRVMFPWGEEENLEVRDLVTRLNRIRQQSEALRRGEVINLSAGQWHYAYARETERQSAVVVLNNHGVESYNAAIDVTDTRLTNGTVLVDALTGKEYTVQGGEVLVEVAPRTGVVLLPKAGLAGQAVLYGAFGLLLVGISGTYYMRRRRRA